MISLAATMEGDYAGRYQQNSFSNGVGTSCSFSRGLQVDGEQEWGQGRATEKAKGIAAYWCDASFAWKIDWHSCSSDYLFSQCHICKSVTNYGWLCLKATETLSSMSRKMGFLSIAIKISSFSAVDSLIATSVYRRALWSTATILLT